MLLVLYWCQSVVSVMLTSKYYEDNIEVTVLLVLCFQHTGTTSEETLWRKLFRKRLIAKF